jgi:hypothetical protein
MCSSSPPPPDPAIGQAAVANAELGREAMDYYKAKDAEMKPYYDKSMQIALDQSKAQIDTARKQNEYADETKAYERSTFRPLEQKIATDALGYDTPARREAEAAQAQADVGTAGDAVRANIAREVQSRGGDVNSGNYTAALAGAGVREAAAKAGAGNQARKNVEAIGGAKLADAASLGRGIAATNATQTQLGLQAGNSAVANSMVPGTLGAQQVGLSNQTTGTAMQGNSSAGNLLLGQYNAQTGANQAANSTSNALIGAAGTAAGGFFGRPAGAVAGGTIFGSDKNVKEGRKPVSGKVALSMVRKMPVESWRYKDSSKYKDGGANHIGPMAQDVQKAAGNRVAPGGKVIDLISMNGLSLASVQHLDKRLAKVEKKISLAAAKKQR